MALLNALGGLMILVPLAALLLPLMNRMNEDETQKVRVSINENERER